MGTRGLIVVYDQNGRHRIANYGQWDHYPSGQGKDILAFLQDARKVDALKNYRLKGCRFLTPKEIEKIDKNPNWPAFHPQLSRNMGAGILNLAATVDGLSLVDSINFAADSLFCEWAYVISFKDNEFEIYKGFNTTPAIGRFKDLPCEPGSEYTPVTLIKSYKLDALPTVEQFLAELEPQDDEEEEIA